jgi:hypothetical protein
MSINRDNDRLPDDVLDVVTQLRENRPEASALELDRIKQRARAQALRPSNRTKGHLLRSRLTVALLSLGLMVGGTSGVIAAKGGNGKSNGAAKSQYKPGYGPCKKGGTTPAGQHTGPPGNAQGGTCATKPGGGTSPNSPGNGNNNGNNGNGPGGNQSANNGKGGNGK